MGIVRRCITALVACMASAAFSQDVEWIPLAETATSISIGAKGQVWATLGPNGVPALWMRTGFSRTKGAGTRVASGAHSVQVPSEALLIGGGNVIYRAWGDGSAVTWAPVATSPPSEPGRPWGNSYGIDVGIGGGKAWAIGTGSAGSQGNKIYRWAPAGPGESYANWREVPGVGGVRIAVEPSGNAWVLDRQWRMWRYNGSGWDQVSTNIFAKEIGIGGDGTVFIVGVDDALWLKTDLNYWKRMGDTKFKGVAVDPQGNPWAIRMDGIILRGVLKRTPGAVAVGADTIKQEQFLPPFRSLDPILPSGHYMKSGKTVGVVEHDGRFCMYTSGDPKVHRPFLRCIPKEPMATGAYKMELRDDGNLCIMHERTRKQMWCMGVTGERGTGNVYYGKLEPDGFSVYRVDPNKYGSDRLLWATRMTANSSQSPYVTLDVGQPSELGRIVGDGVICGGPGGNSCLVELWRGQDVTLRAEPLGEGRFKGWQPRTVVGTTLVDPNAICKDVGNSVCKAKMDQDQYVRARFQKPLMVKLTVFPPDPSEAGNAMAVVSYANQRAECPTPAAGCVYPMEENTKVEIVSTPKAGLELKTGEGMCKGQAEKCVFTMASRDESVWIMTKKPPVPLPVVTLVPTPGRRITAQPIRYPAPGTPQPYRKVTCPTECKLAVGAGQMVGIDVETPYLLRGWAGACATENRYPPPPPQAGNMVTPGCTLLVDRDKEAQPLYK
jgi:hypothetical protein